MAYRLIILKGVCDVGEVILLQQWPLRGRHTIMFPKFEKLFFA